MKPGNLIFQGAKSRGFKPEDEVFIEPALSGRFLFY